MHLDTPAGVVVATALWDGRRCSEVTLEMPTACVTVPDVTLEVPGFGGVQANVVCAGVFFAAVDASTLGLAPETATATLIDAGRRIAAAANPTVTAQHPQQPDTSGIHFTLFCWDLQRYATGGREARTAV